MLREHLARRVDSVVSWSLLYQQTALANLLEVRVSSAQAWARSFKLPAAGGTYR